MVNPGSDEFKNQVRQATDIVDLVGEYVQLKKSGRSYLGLCPFHSEKTPSFHVNPDWQTFHCFGCKAGGDVFSFLMQMEQLSFVEALQKLANRLGLVSPDMRKQEGSPEYAAKAAMYEAHEFVAKLYHHVLTTTPHGLEALNYLERRGITRATIDEFQLGYAPNSWDFTAQHLQKRNYSLPHAVEAGLLAQSDKGKIFDRFRGRLMFPIHDTNGKVIGFGGRSLDGSHPKYLNSPDSPLFHKSMTIFNFHRARPNMKKRKQVILFEGYLDVISAWQAGFQLGVATLGTAITEPQARLIKRNADQVTLCYDGDFAGQEATGKAIELLREAGCSIRIAPLPQGVDPDDYIRQNGAEAFSQQVLLQAMPVTEFRLKHLRSKYVIQDEDDQKRYIQQALVILNELDSPIERDMYERKLAEEFSLTLDALKLESKRVFKQQKLANQRDKVKPVWNNSINNGKFTLTKTLEPAYQKAERMLLYYMMQSQEIALRVQEQCNANFAVDEHGALAAFLYAYYAENHPENPGNFIHYLEDEKLKQLASGLAMMECREDVSEQEIDDYIRQVNNYPKRAELERLREDQQNLRMQAVNTDNEEAKKQLFIEAAKVGIKIHELENALREG